MQVKVNNNEVHVDFKKFWSKYGHIPIGFSLNTNYENEWKEMGLFCPYEHCIAAMPIKVKRDKNSCPLFGHDCPDISKCPYEDPRKAFFNKN
jgi:hypothetical protein